MKFIVHQSISVFFKQQRNNTTTTVQNKTKQQTKRQVQTSDKVQKSKVAVHYSTGQLFSSLTAWGKKLLLKRVVRDLMLR